MGKGCRWSSGADTSSGRLFIGRVPGGRRRVKWRGIRRGMIQRRRVQAGDDDVALLVEEGQAIAGQRLEEALQRAQQQLDPVARQLLGMRVAAGLGRLLLRGPTGSGRQRTAEEETQAQPDRSLHALAHLPLSTGGETKRVPEG